MSKGRIINIKRFEIHDGPGIRTTVFLKGCPLRCLWCHNPESVSSEPEIGYYKHKCINCGECVNVCETRSHRINDGVHIFDREKCVSCGKCVSVCLGEALVNYFRYAEPEEIFAEIIQDKDFFASSGGGITVSGGEPLIQPDFVSCLFRLSKENGIGTAADTCLYVSKENIDKVLPYTDIFLVDIKAVDPGLHKKLTGADNALILDNLLYLDNLGIETEIRFPFIPGANETETEKVAAFVSKLKNSRGIKVLPYHNYAVSKYESLDRRFNVFRVPSKEETEKQKQIFAYYGVRVIEN